MAVSHYSQLDVNQLYSYADYLTWKFEEAIELIKGRLVKMSTPNRRHQRISRELSGRFYLFFQQQPCEFYAAPFDVRLLDKRQSSVTNLNIMTVVQPDLCIICDTHKLDDWGCLGAPDLVVEILSPSNATKEIRLKKDLYEENGIREYWIFDPEHETVHQFHLTKAGTYELVHIYVSDEVLACVIFPELQIALADIFYDATQVVE